MDQLADYWLLHGAAPSRVRHGYLYGGHIRPHARACVVGPPTLATSRSVPRDRHAHRPTPYCTHHGCTPRPSAVHPGNCGIPHPHHPSRVRPSFVHAPPVARYLSSPTALDPRPASHRLAIPHGAAATPLYYYFYATILADSGTMHATAHKTLRVTTRCPTHYHCPFL